MKSVYFLFVIITAVLICGIYEYDSATYARYEPLIYTVNGVEHTYRLSDYDKIYDKMEAVFTKHKIPHERLNKETLNVSRRSLNDYDMIVELQKEAGI